MKKVILQKMTDEEKKLRSHNKESMRNILGYCYKSELDYTFYFLSHLCKEKNIGLNIYDNRQFNNQSYDTRIEFSEPKLLKELNKLDNNVETLGIFVENVSLDDFKIDNDRFVFVVYFTLKGKALTKFKKVLTENFFEIV